MTSRTTSHNASMVHAGRYKRSSTVASITRSCSGYVRRRFACRSPAMTSSARARSNTCVVKRRTSKRGGRFMTGLAGRTSHNVCRWFFHYIGISTAMTSRTTSHNARVIHGGRRERSSAVASVTTKCSWYVCSWFTFRANTVTSGTRPWCNPSVVEYCTSKRGGRFMASLASRTGNNVIDGFAFSHRTVMATCTTRADASVVHGWCSK
jgi:hypothetical protein